jgi:hypothetical protein
MTQPSGAESHHVLAARRIDLRYIRLQRQTEAAIRYPLRSRPSTRLRLQDRPFGSRGSAMYQIVKDFLVPLIAPTVAIIVPTILFFVIPRKRDRQKTALDLFTAFTAEEMRKSRLEVWAYFVTQVNGNLDEQNKRFDQYLDYLTEDRGTASITTEVMDLFLKTSRVLDYFVFVEACVQQRLVNEELIRSFLAGFYLWWRDKFMVPMRKRRHHETKNPRFLPLWWRPLVHLDRVAGVPA